MKKKRNGTIFFLALLLSGTVYAGDLDSPSGPGAAGSYTLEDVHNRLDTGEAGTQSTFTEPPPGPLTGTGHTINDIMDAAPAIDDTNGATAGDVVSGKTFWGLTSGAWGLHTGTAFVSGESEEVSKTGQTECWDSDGHAIDCSGTGQDGEYQKGASAASRFAENGDGTVTDKLTGLIWLKNANCANGQRQWATALTDVESLNSDGTMNGNNCGDTSNAGNHQTDWRLPDVKELQSLIDYQCSYPALPASHPFSGVKSDRYWSGTVCAGSPSYAWHVGLHDGGNGNHLSMMSPFYVWPVRGGQ